MAKCSASARRCPSNPYGVGTLGAFVGIRPFVLRKLHPGDRGYRSGVDALHYDGTSCSALTSLTSETLPAVWDTSSGDLCIRRTA